MAESAAESSTSLIYRLSTYKTNCRKNKKSLFSPPLTATMLSLAGFSCDHEPKIVCLNCGCHPNLELVEDLIHKSDVSITIILIIEHLKYSDCSVSTACLEIYLSDISESQNVFKDIFDPHKLFRDKISNARYEADNHCELIMKKENACEESRVYDQLSFKALEKKCNMKDMRQAKARLLTFKDWKFGDIVTPLALASDGFYRFRDTAAADSVKCVYCGLVLCDWEDGDIVYNEHKDKSPACPFRSVSLDKDMPFNEAEVYYHRCLMLFTDCAFSKFLKNGKITNKELKYILQLFESKDNQMLTNKKILSFLSLDSCYKNGKSINFGNNRLDKSLTSTVAKLKRKDMTQDEIQHAISALKDENTKLRETKLCKICVDKEVNTVFLPCGHLVSCQGCAPKIRNCAVCRTLIRGTVLAFIPSD